MKIMISFLSAVIVFAGIIHFFGENFPVPNKGTGYSIVLIMLGIIIIVLSIINKLLMGLEKFVLIIQGLLLVGVAILPFFSDLLTFIPREGFLYAGVIILIGALGLIYGLLGMG